MEGQLARSAEVRLNYDGVNISEDISPFFVSFTFTDNSGDKADDIALILEDRRGAWRGEWFPSKGAEITADIITHDWDGPGSSSRLPCGVFAIDQIECSGPPTQVSIKGISPFTKTPIRQERRTKTWEAILLKDIAQDIADRNELDLFWDVPDEPPIKLERRDQTEQADLPFLAELCRTYGIAVKVSEGQLICYDEITYEKKDAGGTIAFGDKHLKSYRFCSKTNDTYKGARLQYHDPVKAVDLDVYADGGLEHVARILELNQKADSPEDAEKIARHTLHNRNKREITGNIVLIGDPAMLASSNIRLEGWGNFDGKYFMEKVTHTIDGSGYTTTLDIRMCGE